MNPSKIPICPNHMAMQSGNCQSGSRVVGVAKCGKKEGVDMIGQIAIIAPAGKNRFLARRPAALPWLRLRVGPDRPPGYGTVLSCLGSGDRSSAPAGRFGTANTFIDRRLLALGGRWYCRAGRWVQLCSGGNRCPAEIFAPAAIASVGIAKSPGSARLGRHRRQWFAKRKSVAAILKEVLLNQEAVLIDSDAGNKAADADAALQELGADLVAFGHVTTTLTVWDEDRAAAAEKLRAVERIINGRGFVTIRETLNAVEAWLSSLPGHCYANVRQPLVHTLNLAHMIPLVIGHPRSQSTLQRLICTFDKA